MKISLSKLQEHYNHFKEGIANAVKCYGELTTSIVMAVMANLIFIMIFHQGHIAVDLPDMAIYFLISCVVVLYVDRFKTKKRDDNAKN